MVTAVPTYCYVSGNKTGMTTLHALLVPVLLVYLQRAPIIATKGPEGPPLRAASTVTQNTLPVSLTQNVLGPHRHRFREVSEEVSLWSLSHTSVHTRPVRLPAQGNHHSQHRARLGNHASIVDNLCTAPCKVAHVFDHPLEALLDPEL